MSTRAEAVAPNRTAWSFTWTKTRVVLLALVGLGTGVALYRLVFGLGAATNLSDGWPWGLWVWWDVLTGVALAGGGYSTALLVNFLGREEWRPVERGAFLTSLIGYLLVCMGLLLDLGRWYRAWHPLVYWGYHSVMFQLFFYDGGYTLVQLVEFLHIFVERVRAPRLARVTHAIYAPVLIFGIILPFLHQPALGSLYVIAKGRLDPLWWTMLLPFLFLLSSFFVGPAMVTVENFLSARAHRTRPPIEILGQMLRLAAWLIWAYLALRVVDLLVRGELARAFRGNLQGNLFLLENVVFFLVPAVLLLVKRVRQSAKGMALASALVVLGIALNRANVVFTGMTGASRGASYLPSWMELSVTLGLISAGVLLYLFVTENFPILPSRPRAREEALRG